MSRSWRIYINLRYILNLWCESLSIMGSTPTRVLRTHLHSNQDETNAREEKTTGFGSPRIGTTSEQGNHTLGKQRRIHRFFFEEQAREIDSSDSRDKSFPLLETHHPQGWASYDIILTLLKDGIAYEGAIPVRKEFTCEGPKVSKMREKRAEAKMELLYGNYKYTCPRSHAWLYGPGLPLNRLTNIDIWLKSSQLEKFATCSSSCMPPVVEAPAWVPAPNPMLLCFARHIRKNCLNCTTALVRFFPAFSTHSYFILLSTT